MKSRFTLLDGLTFRVLSQEPVIRHVYVGPLTMWHVFTGPSWAATCITWSEARSQSLTCLSQEATNTLLPSSDQQTSDMSAPPTDDNQCFVDVRLIDFAHTAFVPRNGSMLPTPAAAPVHHGPDGGFLTGLDSLNRLLNEILAEERI